MNFSLSPMNKQIIIVLILFVVAFFAIRHFKKEKLQPSLPQAKSEKDKYSIVDISNNKDIKDSLTVGMLLFPKIDLLIPAGKKEIFYEVEGIRIKLTVDPADKNRILRKDTLLYVTALKHKYRHGFGISRYYEYLYEDVDLRGLSITTITASGFESIISVSKDTHRPTGEEFSKLFEVRNQDPYIIK